MGKPNEVKISGLRLIREQEDLLFGKFSDTLTYDLKNKCWDEIYGKLLQWAL